MKEKIDLLVDLEEKEKNKLPKFYATLALSTIDELRSTVEYLRSKNIKITKANHIKILGNTLEELQNKFSVMEQLENYDVLNHDPIYINRNVIDLYKRITYCKQYGIDVKNEDGTYKNFLFNTALWNEEIEKAGKKEPALETVAQEVPKVEAKSLDSTPSVNASENKDDYFEKIRAELEETRKALYNEFQFLEKNEEQSDNLISFDQLDDIGMGRAA